MNSSVTYVLRLSVTDVLDRSARSERALHDKSGMIRNSTLRALRAFAIDQQVALRSLVVLCSPGNQSATDERVIDRLWKLSTAVDCVIASTSRWRGMLPELCEGLEAITGVPRTSTPLWIDIEIAEQYRGLGPIPTTDLVNPVPHLYETLGISLAHWDAHAENL